MTAVKNHAAPAHSLTRAHSAKVRSRWHRDRVKRACVARHRRVVMRNLGGRVRSLISGQVLSTRRRGMSAVVKVRRLATGVASDPV